MDKCWYYLNYICRCYPTHNVDQKIGTAMKWLSSGEIDGCINHLVLAFPFGSYVARVECYTCRLQHWFVSYSSFQRLGAVWSACKMSAW